MTKRQRTTLITILLLTLSLTGCKNEASASRRVMVLADGGIGSNSGVSAVGIASEQVSGYQRYLETDGGALDLAYIDESMADKDLQRELRDAVQSVDQPLMAIVGATTNNASGHGAALVNFFSVPLILPSADGDNLFPVGNLWAFRLSPPSSAYANTLFNGYVTKTEIQAIRAKLTDALNPAPVFNVGILYEENSFGEAAAVATAKAVTGQELRVGMYQSFDPTRFDPASLRDIVTASMGANIQLVYIISSDPAISMNLVTLFGEGYAKEVPPILVGQGAGFTGKAFLASDSAGKVYILRQALDSTACPPGVASEAEAQSYAALSLLDHALRITDEASVTRSGLLGWLDPNKTTIEEKRESLRDAIKSSDISIPCLGKVAFDNAGQNSQARIELVKKNGDVWEVVQPSGLVEALSGVMFERMFE